MEDALFPEIDDTLKAGDTALEELEREETVRSPGLGKRDRITPGVAYPGWRGCRHRGAANNPINPLSYFQGRLLPSVMWPSRPRKAKDATRN